MSPVVVAVDWRWGMMIMIVLRLLMVDQRIGGLTSKSALNSSKVLSFFVLNFWGVDWNAVDRCWSIFVDRSFVVMMESSLGFSVGGEVSVFSGDDFWGL